MKNIKLLTLICLLCTATSIYPQNNVGKDLNTYFEFVKEIKLPDEIIAEYFTYIDVYEDKIVIADKFMKDAYLLNNNGKILKKLNPDECHPGIKWLPYGAYFNKKGDILILSGSPPWGFMFDKNGKCLGPVDATFLGSDKIAFTQNDQIIGYNSHNRYNKNSLILMNSEGKEIKNFGVFPEKFKNLIARRYGGGLVTDNDDNIYQLNVISYEITKYDKNGSFIKTLRCKPHYYIPPQRDYSNTKDMQQMMRESSKLAKFSNAQRLYLLDKDIIAAEYYYNEKYELVLCNLEGSRLNKYPITYEKQRSLFGKNGLLYFVDEKKDDKKGDPVNPTIKVYRFKSNMRGK